MIEDMDYVFVDADDMSADDSSYDHCDDNLSSISPAPPFTELVGTHSDKPEIDNNLLLALTEEGDHGSSIVSLEDAEEQSCAQTLRDVPAPDPVSENPPELTPQPTADAQRTETKQVKTVKVNENSSEVQFHGSRLSNKKRRKKLKLMKREAAAAAAAEALANQNQNARSKDGVKTRHKSKLMASKSKKKSQFANIAVACAAESLAEFRHEHGVKAPKSSTLNYIHLL